MSNVKIHNFSNKLSTTYPRFGDKLIITSGKHVNTRITRCTPGADRKNTTGCVREGWTPESEGREELKSGGLDIGEGMHEGKMKNRKKIKCSRREKKGEIGRKKAATGITREEVKSVKVENKWKIAEKAV